MIPKHFKNQYKSSIGQNFAGRRKLLKPFVKRYGKPILVHSVQDKEVFLKILRDTKIKLPNNHSSSKKTPLMERILKTDNCIYYSLGFVYLTSYDWKYNLIFDLDYLKYLTYYKGGIHFKAYRIFVDYLYENDKEYLEKIADKNKLTREVIDKYYYKKYNGEFRKILEFWKIEKNLFEALNNYSRRKEVVRLIRKMASDYVIDYPYSKRDAKKVYLLDHAPEVVGRKENSLSNNELFLGFYIKDGPDKVLLKMIKNMYPDKIIFDGKKIKKVSELN